MSQIKREFRKWAKEHPNFMTPTIVKLLEHKGFIIELSEGTDFKRNRIYGVTSLKELKCSECTSTKFKSMNDELGISGMHYSYSEALITMDVIKRALDSVTMEA